MAKGLTPKQARFVEEYLLDLNATQAAIRAGYSEKTANQIGPKLLVNVGIAAAIQKAKDKRSERTAITTDMVLRGLLTEAQGEGDDSNSSARIRAWELLGKHLKMFAELHEHTMKPFDQWTEEECEAFLSANAEGAETRH